jgi:hypothetical protein
MQNIINTPKAQVFHKPIEKCQHYCIAKGTRYGFVVTDKELVVLRIREESLEDGIVTVDERGRTAHFLTI